MTLPLIIVLVFFAVVFLIGIIDRRKVTIEDYWVNGRKTNKFVLVATIASSFLGVAALISNAGIAFSGGGLATAFLFGSFLFYFIIFAKFFAPKIKEFGDQHGAYTVPDFLEFRYGPKVRVAGLIVNLFSFGLFLALQILGIGIFISSVGGFDPLYATILGGAIIIAYTTVGGLRADIRTDIFQLIIMLTLIFIFLPFLIMKGGGFQSIAALPVSFLSGHEFAPWYVFILGLLFLGASNMVSGDLWQRAYASDSVKNVRWAMKISGIIIFIFFIAGTLFGVYGKILLPEANANNIVPELMKLLLSPGLFGLVLAGFFAAIMSTADTMLLLVSMTLIHDFYQKTMKKELSTEATLRLSRWTTLVIGLVALILAVTIFSVVHIAIEAVSFFVALLPAITFGFYWKKATTTAAFWSIIVGTLTIIIFLFIDPVQAFIPGIITSFLAFFLVNFFARKKLTSSSE
ncbi:MAG: sodium:solute symporter family protein [bacterium]